MSNQLLQMPVDTNQRSALLVLIDSDIYVNYEQLLATDILVLVTMKNAAKCDT
jgi:hypothetical protein